MGKQHQEQNEKTTLRERFADAVDLSKEVILDAVIISAIGDRELILENYKSILSYSDTTIKIKAKPYPIIVVGTGLEIRNISRDMLYLTGRIHSVSFHRDHGRD